MTDATIRSLEPFLDAHPTPILVQQGERYLFVNRALCQVTGRDRAWYLERTIGESLRELAGLLPDERDRLLTLHSKQQLTRTPGGPLRFKLVLGDGSLQSFVSSGHVAFAGAQIVYLFDDSGDDRVTQAARRLSAAATRLSLMHDVDEICAAAVQAIWAEGMGNGVLLREGELLVYRAVAAEPEVIAEAERGWGRPIVGTCVNWSQRPPLAQVVTGGRVLQGEDGFELSERLHPASRMRATGRNRYVLLPLCRGTEVFGMIQASCRELPPSMVATLELFGAQLSAALENARLFAELGGARERLVERERLAAVGETAAVLAHELRNSLAVIYNGLAMMRLEGDVSATVSTMQEEAERLNRLLADLLNFSRPLTLQIGSAALGSIVEKATVLAERTLGTGTRLEITQSLAEAPQGLKVDSDLVCQALANLMVNAAQSMETPGPIHLAARRKGAEVALAVEDRGRGILPAVLPRLFQPFFTTRPQGTGLGLALVHKIAAAHGGRATAENRPEGGACFTLWLPAA